MQRIYLLKGKVQHYSWGGFHFIPDLLGRDNTENKPFAEYWMGSHPSYSSYVTVNNNNVLLSHFLKENGGAVLGEKQFRECSSLPYLFKILDVRQMLSIQVHPSKEEAEIGFDKEEKKGIDIGAANRNYKDKNHKPEMMVALSDFWLLHGFKKEDKLLEQFTKASELQFLKNIFSERGYEGLFSFVMTMDELVVNERLHVLAQRILPLYEQNMLDKSSEDFWAARAIKTFCTKGAYDRGIFCIYLFNLLQLCRGEGVFQPAGMPHAYLEGQNVEIMANSDNVLRAGLTDKHIDVTELLKHTICTPTLPNIFKGNGMETAYPSQATEFGLHQYNVGSQRVSFNSSSAEIIIVLEGKLVLHTTDEEMLLQKGDSALVTAGNAVHATSTSGALFFRATAGSS